MADRKNNSGEIRKRNTSGLRRGGPGRPKGVPNKATQEAKEIARALVFRTEYLAELQRRLDAKELPPPLEAMLWHYAAGKPKETQEITGPDGGPLSVARIERVIVHPEDKG